MKEILRSIIKMIPVIGKIYKENLLYKINSFYPPGHFYSSIISVEDLKKREHELWKTTLTEGIDGIDLNSKNQIQLLNNLKEYYKDLPFEDEKKENLRYYYNNIFYSYSDAITLYSMMRHFKPKRIIEVGSGFSSALMLDVNDIFFEKQIHFTFIEPYPERLLSLINEKDIKNHNIIKNDIQQTGTELFKELKRGDILFIDGSHVAKTGSDVNHLLFEILPVINSGVLIHFHDIFYPFEYPKKWVLGGNNWNEIYFLRAFLMHNNAYEIKLFSDYLHKFYKPSFTEMPLCYKNTGGHIWLEKK